MSYLYDTLKKKCMDVRSIHRTIVRVVPYGPVRYPWVQPEYSSWKPSRIAFEQSESTTCMTRSVESVLTVYPTSRVR